MAVPTLTHAERAEALAKATKARQARAELRAQLTDGTCTLTDLFAKSDAGDEIAARMTIHSAISALPSYGVAKTDALLDKCKISRTRRVRGVGVRQRERLLEEMRNRRR